MKKIVFLCCCFGSSVYANDLEQYCKQVPAINQKAQQLYQQQQYTKARNQYHTAVAYLESCAANFQNVPKKNLDIAYNNVAITYIKQKQYRKAVAWLSLAPNAPQTLTNLRFIPALAISKQPQGEYWKYAGQSMWDTYTITPQKNQYKIEFSGLYVGINSLLSGPNMGDYKYFASITNHQTTWVEPDNQKCKIQIKFEQNHLIAKTDGDTTECGFGHNVMADGTYQRVL